MGEEERARGRGAGGKGAPGKQRDAPGAGAPSTGGDASGCTSLGVGLGEKKSVDSESAPPAPG